MRFIFILPIFILALPLDVRSQVKSKDSTDIIYNSFNGDSEDIIYPDVMPKFPGGDEALGNFLRKNIVYPAMAKEMGIQGKVYARFIVEKDGSISNLQIAKGISDECNKEVLRVLKLMPKWEPGINKEQIVRVQFQLPVSFILK